MREVGLYMTQEKINDLSAEIKELRDFKKNAEDISSII